MPKIEDSQIAALLVASTPEAARELQKLSETAPEKAQRKEARRALYLLSQEGITPPKRQTAEIEREPRNETLQARASAYDGSGEVLLLFHLPDPDGGWPTLILSVMNDLKGVIRWDPMHISRQAAVERIRSLENSKGDGLAFTEIEADYARFLIETARALNTKTGNRTPPGFIDWLPRIGSPRQLYELPPIHFHFSADAVLSDSEISRDASDLFALNWFDGWFLRAEAIFPWIDRWVENQTEEANPSQETSREVNSSLLVEIVAELITPEVRSRYQHRLEFSADILRRMGEMDVAKQTLFHALELKSERPVTEVSFAKELVRRTLEVVREVMQNRKQSLAEEEDSRNASSEITESSSGGGIISAT